MKPILALLKDNGLYQLIDIVPGSCYNIRAHIKSQGGKWDGKSWTVPFSALSSLNIDYLVNCEVDRFCCIQSIHSEFVPHSDLIRGYTIKNFCSHCDSTLNNINVRVIKEIK